MSILDIASKTIDASIKVGEEPEGVATSPDGRWVYVTCESSNAVDVIDVSKRTVIKEIKVGTRPRGAAFLPDSSKAYVTSETAGSVSVISLPQQHALVRTLKLSGEGMRPMGVAVAPDGKHAYVTTGHGGVVVVIDTVKDENHRIRIAVGRRPWGITLRGRQTTLYTTNGGSDEQCVVDTPHR